MLAVNLGLGCMFAAFIAADVALFLRKGLVPPARRRIVLDGLFAMVSSGIGLALILAGVAYFARTLGF